MKVIIDRIESGRAVLVFSDDEHVRFELPLKCLPKEAAEGDHFNVSFRRDKKSGESGKARVSRILDEIRKK